jgi:hypothetical protein
MMVPRGILDEIDKKGVANDDLMNIQGVTEENRQSAFFSRVGP